MGRAIKVKLESGKLLRLGTLEEAVPLLSLGDYSSVMRTLETCRDMWLLKHVAKQRGIPMDDEDEAERGANVVGHLIQGISEAWLDANMRNKERTQ